MESLVIDPVFWRDKRVLLTGHTGFKGGWLALWLQKLGAEVHGLALAPETEPSLFQVAGVAEGMRSVLGDINDLPTVLDVFQRAEPEIVIHMAAQPLVRRSYAEPALTYRTNVMGTLHVLEAIRMSSSVKAAVMVTTDKCYDNREWPWPYRESDALGGHDPYSSSKACMELLVASYRHSYFIKGDKAIATARAGNVIGGGDWAEDRLVPDLVKALANDRSIEVRNPLAIRPWQHVLEPLAGYLRLAECLYNDGQGYAEAWNFGPGEDANRNVGWIVKQVAARWPALSWHQTGRTQPHEAHQLKLDCSKARSTLGWRSRWSLPQAIENTLDWYAQHHHGNDMKDYCWRQIEQYCRTEPTS